MKTSADLGGCVIYDILLDLQNSSYPTKAEFNNIKHERQCFIGYPNTEKRVENTTRSGVFLTIFEMFGYPDETLSRVFDISY